MIGKFALAKRPMYNSSSTNGHRVSRAEFDANTCGLADEAIVVDVDGAVPQVVPDTGDDALGHF